MIGRADADGADQGGESPCFANLVCDRCGYIIEPGAMHVCDGDEDAETARSQS